MLGGAAPEPIAHGVIKVADREGGHGLAAASSAVIAGNASGWHGHALSAALLNGSQGCLLGSLFDDIRQRNLQPEV